MPAAGEARVHIFLKPFLSLAIRYVLDVVVGYAHPVERDGQTAGPALLQDAAVRDVSGNASLQSQI